APGGQHGIDGDSHRDGGGASADHDEVDDALVAVDEVGHRGIADQSHGAGALGIGGVDGQGLVVGDGRIDRGDDRPAAPEEVGRRIYGEGRVAFGGGQSDRPAGVGLRAPSGGERGVAADQNPPVG